MAKTILRIVNQQRHLLKKTPVAESFLPGWLNSINFEDASGFDLRMQVIQFLVFEDAPLPTNEEFTGAETQEDVLINMIRRSKHTLQGQKEEEDLLRGEEKIATKGLPCRKCHAEAVSYVTAQLRSADEAASVFFHCAACGTTWRVG